MSEECETLNPSDDIQTVYKESLKCAPPGTVVLSQNIVRLDEADSLFYTNALVNDKVSLQALLDTGSMACTLSEEAERELKSAGVALELSDTRTDIVLVGCGGVQVKPKSICELKMEVYDCTFRVPALVVPGQKDQLILGTNVIKHLLRHFRLSPHFWQVLSKPESAEAPEIVQFLNMLSGINRWRGDKMPDVIGTVKLAQAVTLLPKQEHLVWGRLPASSPLSEGSAILVEPPKSQTHKKGVIVCRTVVSMSGDRWVPVRILNTCDKPITLRRNAKVADASACVAVEDLEVASDQNPSETLRVQSQTVCSDAQSSPPSCPSLRDSLQKMGLEDLDLDSCEVSDHWKAQVLQLIHRYEDVFSKGKLDCGLAKDFVHRIHLSDDRPFRLPYRRVPPRQYHKLRQVLTEMEERELIRKSNSEWASPLVLVWKKNGDLRICVDYRWLNARTVKDAHPLPHQSDCLAALGGNAIFSAMDLTSGFYNIEMAEEDKKLTAFTTPMGLYEFNRLPQGLCNSPASFMRLMMGIFGDQNFLTLLCYLDDLLVYAPNEAEALRRLEIVFSRLRAHGLKLAPKKCHLLRRSVRFLGHVVTEGGVSTDPDKVKAITAISEADLMMEDGVTPSQKKIKSFLGMVMYYQHFIQDCSKIARPLFTLTAAPKGKKVNARGAASFRRLSPSDWKKEHVDSFERLKAALLDSVVLAHPDFNKPFILSTDASQDGLGAVLSQVQEGESKARPVAFASKALARAQRNYPAHRLEFLALKWSVCDKFSHWLKGHSFTVWTDNNPLTYILTKPKLDACEQRWVSKLSPYDFSIKYIPGSKNVVADALSRQPFVHNRVSQRLMTEPYATLLEESQQVKEISVQDAFRLSANHQSVECLAPAESLGCCSLTNDEVSAVFAGHAEWDQGSKQRAISWLTQELDRFPSLGQNTLSAFSLQELQEEQRADVTLSQVIPFVVRGRRPSRRERAHLSHRAQKTMKQWEKLKVLDGILYRVSKDLLTGKKRHQYVTPSTLISQVLSGVHDDAGHQGQSRTLYLARQRFFWINMEHDIREHVKCCKRCVVSKTLEPEGRAPLESIKTTGPLELVCIDFWSAEDHRGKSVDVLVVTDHFTKMAHAFQCSDQTAKQVARQLWDRYFCVYGFPQRIHSDQGANFESELIQELLQVAGVQKSRTTPYHPMGNGHTERFNRTLGNMIRALPPREKHKWPQMLQTLTFVYNCTAHESTGYAPFFLMYGRIPRLPVDVMFHNVARDNDVTDYDSYVKRMRDDLREALALAQTNTGASQQRQADLYNKKQKGVDIEEGDRVLLANKGERGRRKLADRWESTIYTVISKNPTCHTYRIRNVKSGQEKVVHRNLLLQANFLPIESEGEPEMSFASESELGQEQSQSDGESPVADPEDDCTERTARWVAQMTDDCVPAPRGPQECDSIGDSVCAQLDDEEHQDSDSASSEVAAYPEVDDDNNSRACTTPVEEGTLPSISYPESQPVSEVGSLVKHGGVPPSNAAGQIRTRVGRIVKPVNRLIQTMKQRNLQTGNVVSSFAKNLFL